MTSKTKSNESGPICSLISSNKTFIRLLFWRYWDSMKTRNSKTCIFWIFVCIYISIALDWTICKKNKSYIIFRYLGAPHLLLQNTLHVFAFFNYKLKPHTSICAHVVQFWWCLTFFEKSVSVTFLTYRWNHFAQIQCKCQIDLSNGLLFLSIQIKHILKVSIIIMVQFVAPCKFTFIFDGDLENAKIYQNVSMLEE